MVEKKLDVIIEREARRTGWAVYTGCEGDDPRFLAFFTTRENAENYIKVCQLDVDAEWYLCDPDIAPAVVVGDEIVCANDFDFVKGAEAVIAVAGLNDFEASDLRHEAKEAMTNGVT